MGNFPKNPKKGETYTTIVNNKKIGKRKVTFMATGKKKWGKWKIIKNEPA